MAQLPEASFYILVAMDGYSDSGRVVAANDIAAWRLDKAIWGIYPTTRNRKSIKVGDRVAIYVGGTKKNKQHFVAHAVVSSLDRPNLRTFVDPEGVSNLQPETVLKLEHIVQFEPKPIADLLDTLSFVPPNRKKWGCSLMGGTRRITKSDFRKILKA